ncbi:hypothetical protein [Glaciecola petra]|uniref:Uncharacterized protein n=1 Tax=Glaciecola petra TaxID=3075602 RepID=A0ABU2ZUA5_9ALTE|nr:hypothetical protein [Aestuariibacter sp. P117]MDT0595899.1 hypothetical protein [Aestuariibacter sp. P117]
MSAKLAAKVAENYHQGDKALLCVIIITKLTIHLTMKNTLSLIIVVTFIALLSYLFFFNKSATDRAFQNSVNDNARTSDNFKVSKKGANAAIKSDTKNPPSPSNDFNINDSAQFFNYGECFYHDPELESRLDEKRENYLDTLGKSSVKDDKIAYVLFKNMIYDLPSELQKENRLKIDALSELNLFEEPLIALEIMHTCTIYLESEHCNNQLFEEITSQHRDDSEIWLRALGYYLKTGQDELVFNAIEQLKQSKYSSSYSHLFINAYTQTMENAGIENYNSHVFRALLYYNFAKLPMYNEATAWCRDNLDKDKYAQGCLDMGTALEKLSHDRLSKHIGISFQGLVYSAEGNTDSVKILKQRAQELQPEYLSDDWKKEIEVSKTVYQYENLLRSYIANTAILGERGAFKPLEDEVMAFRESDQYVDCGGF